MATMYMLVNTTFFTVILHVINELCQSPTYAPILRKLCTGTSGTNAYLFMLWVLLLLMIVTIFSLNTVIILLRWLKSYLESQLNANLLKSLLNRLNGQLIMASQKCSTLNANNITHKDLEAIKVTLKSILRYYELTRQRSDGNEDLKSHLSDIMVLVREFNIDVDNL